MAQTVIGLFDTPAEAQQAVETLTGKGFLRANIDISSTGAQSSSYTREDDKEEGGIAGFFKSLFSGDDDDDYNKYSNVAKRSSIVTVHAQSADEAEEAADILDDCGAVNVDERAASYGNSGTATTSGLSDVSNFATSDETKKIPIIEENLQVGKREVLTGGVRLRSRIVERPVEESLRLREENVRVERTTVNRPASGADLANFEGTQIEMTEMAEVPVVSKEARVVEEVSLGKEVEERTETISDTVRKTEVDVEDIDKSDTTTRYSGL